VEVVCSACRCHIHAAAVCVQAAMSGSSPNSVATYILVNFLSNSSIEITAGNIGSWDCLTIIFDERFGSELFFIMEFPILNYWEVLAEACAHLGSEAWVICCWLWHSWHMLSDHVQVLFCTLPEVEQHPSWHILCDGCNFQVYMLPDCLLFK